MKLFQTCPFLLDVSLVVAPLLIVGEWRVLELVPRKYSKTFHAQSVFIGSRQMKNSRPPVAGRSHG